MKASWFPPNTDLNMIELKAEAQCHWWDEYAVYWNIIFLCITYGSNEDFKLEDDWLKQRESLEVCRERFGSFCKYLLL